MADTKRCAKCAATKPTAEFPRSKQQRDGSFSYCRPCKREADRRSRAKHAAKWSAYDKAQYKANPEPAKTRRRRRYYDNPARASAEAVAWARANPDKRRVTTKKYRDANLHGTIREATRRRYATRKGAKAIIFTPAQLAQRAAFYGHRCWVCRAPMTEWDHVKPLSRGGWHCLSNLRPICRTCNAKKSDTWPLAGVA